MQAAIEDVICLDDGNGEPSALAHDESVGKLELHMEDMATTDDLEHTLNPFYIADKELFMRVRKIPQCPSRSCSWGMQNLDFLWITRFCRSHMCLWIPAVCLWEG